MRYIFLLLTAALMTGCASFMAAARKSLLAVEAQGDLLHRELNQCRLDNDDLTRTLHTIPSVEGQLARLKAEEKAVQTRVEKARPTRQPQGQRRRAPVAAGRHGQGGAEFRGDSAGPSAHAVRVPDRGAHR